MDGEAYERKGRPEAMKAFDEAFIRAFGPAERDSSSDLSAASGEALVKEQGRNGRGLIAVCCAIVPPEVIHAAGFDQIRLCGYHCAAGQYDGNNDAWTGPECAIIAGLRKFLQDGRVADGRRIELFVVTSTCERMARLSAQEAPSGGFHVLEVPRERGPEHIRTFWRSQIESLFNRLEELRGAAIGRARLAESVELHMACIEAGRLLLALGPKRCGLAGSDRMQALGAFAFMPPQSWLESARKLLEEAGEGGSDCGGPRLVLIGEPVFHLARDAARMIEDAGGVLVGDMLCCGSGALPDPAVADEPSVEAILDALAERSLMTSPCPRLGPGSGRLARLRRIIGENQAAGVIYFAPSVCPAHRMEAVAIQRLLSSMKTPILTLDCAGSAARTKIRAFIRMLKVTGRGT